MIAPTRPLRLDAHRLIAPRWRAVAITAVVVGLLVLAVLGAVVFHGASTSIDDRLAAKFADQFGIRAAAWLLDVTNPAISVVLLVVVGVWTLFARRPDVLALAVLAPVLATVLAEQVLKPLIGRTFGIQDLLAHRITGSFPSGHQTVATSTAVVVLVAMCQLRPPRAVLTAVSIVLAVWVVAVGVGLVRNGYHYATDTVGAVGLSVAVVLGCALLIDRVAAPIERRLRHRVS